MSTALKTVLITGASRGLGAAVAQILGASAHWHIIALARTVGALEALDDRIQNDGGDAATLVPADITDHDAISKICASIYARWGGLDLWVHSAIHAAPLAPVGHIAAKDFEKSMTQNVIATQHLIACVDPLLRAKDGARAIYCTHCDVIGQKFFGAYGASKAAQQALFESWAVENINSGPQVIEFQPEAMPTATRARFYPGEDRTRLDRPHHQAQQLIDLLK